MDEVASGCGGAWRYMPSRLFARGRQVPLKGVVLLVSRPSDARTAATGGELGWDCYCTGRVHFRFCVGHAESHFESNVCLEFPYLVAIFPHHFARLPCSKRIVSANENVEKRKLLGSEP